MTATHYPPNGFTQSLSTGLRWLIKGALAMVLIILAGMLAVATAIAGLVIAAFALLIRFVGPFGTPTASAYDVQEDGEGLTLEAQKTPRGWTVE